MFSLKLDINCEFLLFENGFKGQWKKNNACFQVESNVISSEQEIANFFAFNTCYHV